VKRTNRLIVSVQKLSLQRASLLDTLKPILLSVRQESYVEKKPPYRVNSPGLVSGLLIENEQ
jgi:hypothetical protein